MDRRALLRSLCFSLPLLLAAAAPAANSAAPTAAGAAPAQAGVSKGSDATTAQAAADRPWDRMIVRSATLSLQVENVERALDLDAFVRHADVVFERLRVLARARGEAVHA